jgi:hypothetical protein
MTSTVPVQAIDFISIANVFCATSQPSLKLTVTDRSTFRNSSVPAASHPHLYRNLLLCLVPLLLPVPVP